MKNILSEEEFLVFINDKIQDAGGVKSFNAKYKTHVDDNILQGAVRPPGYLVKLLGYTRQQMYVKLEEK